MAIFLTYARIHAVYVGGGRVRVYMCVLISTITKSNAF